MINKIKYPLFVVIIMLATILIGCNDAEETTDASEDGSGTDVIKIGSSTQGHEHEFIISLVEAMRDKAGEMSNVEIEIMDSQNDIETQLNQVESLITQGIDVLIPNPVDLQGSSPAVDMAKDAGIPIVQVVSYTEKSPDVFVGADVEESGIMQGEFLMEAMGGEGNLAILLGVIGHSGQIARSAGLEIGLLEVSSDINVVAEQTANWSRDEAMSTTEDWLQRYPEIEAIAAQNDEMALGALLAVEAAGRDDIIVVGIDGVQAALEAVNEGRMEATILDNVVEEGRTAVETAVGLVNGETFPEQILVEHIEITQDNVNEFLE